MKNNIKPDIKTKPNSYGFGRDWSLVLKKDGKIIDEKMLGQGVKVAERVLGMGDYMAHYAEKYRERNPDYDGAVSFSQVSDIIAADLIKVMTGGSYDHLAGVFHGGMTLSDENLEELAEKPSWSMAVE